VVVDYLEEKGITCSTRGLYRIVVLNHLDESFSACLEGLKIFRVFDPVRGPTTVLTGCLEGQLPLKKVLNSLYELHLPVLSVKRMDTPSSQE